MANDVYRIAFDDDNSDAGGGGKRSQNSNNQQQQQQAVTPTSKVDLNTAKLIEINHNHNNRSILTGNGTNDESILFRRNNSDEYYDDDDENDLESNNRIESSSSFDEASLLSFHANIKTLALSLLFLLSGVISNLIVLALIHERVPFNQPPLPDISFDLLPKKDTALFISEYIIMFMSTSVLIMIICHRFRWIIFSRMFIILGILYVLRGICMAVTQVPVSNPQYYCSPQLKSNETKGFLMTKIIFKRVLFMGVGMGLSVNGRHTFCGDFIFSGHTVILVLSDLLLVYYWLSSRKIIWIIVKYCYRILVLIGIIAILLARGHYLVDIVLAFVITYLIFHMYHIMSHYVILAEIMKKKHRYDPNPSKACWFCLFRIMERNVIKHRLRVRNRFQWPWEICICTTNDNNVKK